MMQGQVRRKVTGHDAQGRSIVISDSPAPHVRSNPLRPGHFSTDIWRTNETPARISKSFPEPTDGPRKITPNRNGTVVRISVIPPDTPELLTLDPESARNVFADMGEESASTFTTNRRHPLIHRTQTIDYAILLEGELYMVLDETEVLLNAGDVVVQVGTNHAWSNRSGKPVKIAYVLIDGEFDQELARALGRI